MKLMQNEADIIKLIEQDEWMMGILRTVKELALPDWWICAGFVRSKIWDALHGFNDRTPIPDVDVIYYDTNTLNESVEKEWEDKLRQLLPNIPWSVKNQARMHLRNNLPPYTSSIDAIAKFPETATALGVTINSNDQLLLTAPHGIEDVVSLRIKPTPFFTETNKRLAIYKERIQKKDWSATWPKVHLSC